jgi:hypothetical protein
MENEYGWTVTWKDGKKNIVFTDSENHRVRDSNLNKTFNIDVSKEGLTREFERHTARSTTAARAAKGSGSAKEADRTVGSRKRMAQKDPGRNAGPRR